MKYPETARRFKKALDASGMTQQNLADRCGINKSSISQYVNGSNCPGTINAAKISDALNVNPVWLMGFDVPMVEGVDNEESDIERFIGIFRKLDKRDRNVILITMESMLDSKKKGQD